MPRCFWCTDDPLYMRYHDEEWGVPEYDAGVLFEMLVLDGFQAGLSWLTVLRKRAHYRRVLHGFDPARLAQLSDEEIEQLMQDPGIIRNRAKLRAARQNAQAWLRLEDPVGFLWSFVGGGPKINQFTTREQVPAITSAPPSVTPSCRRPVWSWTTPRSAIVSLYWAFPR
jgi:DNA-3-methyladenine glycosylase I